MSRYSAVHKFGGTSLSDLAGFGRAGEIVVEDSPCAVVVSAMAGVTDQLIEVTQKAEAGDQSFSAVFAELRRRHLRLMDLSAEGLRRQFDDELSRDFSDLGDILQGVFVSRQCSEGVRELVSGYGEKWSAHALSLLLQARGAKAEWLNARDVLFVEHGETGPAVLWQRSQTAFDRYFEKREKPEILVVTGYIASFADGKPTTLKRNGSDFSAAIFAKLACAECLTIWTDVDGVMSADPRKVPQAFVIDSLSYDEAMELAFFGAKVIHPKTMEPVVSASIPLWIRNSFKPELPGTCIRQKAAEADAASPAKGFACIEKVALINVEGSGMLGVPGVAERLFRAMKEAGISVIMISQASSEHSICFAVPEADGERAGREVRRTFFFEIEHGQIQNVDIDGDCAILAVVGDSMARTPGVSATFFSALARAGVNVRAIAQGSSERNISIVIARPQATRALRAVHSGFYLSKLTLSVALIGPGLIGSTLLKQLLRQAQQLRDKENIDLRVRALADSEKMLLADDRIDLRNWPAAFEQGEPVDLSRLTKHVDSDEFPHAVVVDCTSSEEVGARYADWLKRGVHVITPNKKAGSGEIEFYRGLKTLAGGYRAHYLYETTVGAGLPIISTLQELVKTGDRILHIEGVLSGTLSYIFNELAGGRRFSEVVKIAKQNGYTEPDPRDDLSGLDVARKVVILAREVGLSVSLEDIEIESLVPETLQEVGEVDVFLQRLGEFDDHMGTLLEKARENGKVLRYVGEVDPQGKCRAGLKEYPAGHAFARITGSDNIISFVTERYHSQPLTVQGPGAGPEVTAGGVFADLLRLSSYLGRTS